MLHRVKDLSRDQRVAIEALLGRPLEDDEGLNIQSSRVLRDAPVGEERVRAYRQFLGHLDELASRVRDTSDAEMDAIADEACHHARHS